MSRDVGTAPGTLHLAAGPLRAPQVEPGTAHTAFDFLAPLKV